MGKDDLWDGLVIRPSMTSNYVDCPLRGLVRAYPDLFTRLGYVLRDVDNSLAAGIGSAVHAGAHVTLTRKLGMGNLGPDGEAEEAALQSLRESSQDGYIPDDLSPNMNIAEQQVVRMTKCYREHVAPKISPILVEIRRDADAGDGFVISGQADVVAVEPGGIDDLKTGAVERVAMAQLGTYSLIYQPHGYKVDWLRQTFLQRVSLRYAQPIPVEINYPPSLAERVAEYRLRQIKRDVIEFCQTGDPMTIPANPGSMLCGDKWCRAWGTKVCRQHKGAA